MDRNNLKQVKLVFESFKDISINVFFTEDSYLSNTPDDIILLKANQEKSTIYFHKDSIYTFTFANPVLITFAKIEGKVLYCYRLFSRCLSLTNLDVTNLDTSEAFDMEQMFYDCCRLTSLDVSHFDTSNVKYMDKMFCGCTGLTSLDVSNFDTSNVIDISLMFCDCHKLSALDLSKWNISNVFYMNWMFTNCYSLTTIGPVDKASGWQHKPDNYTNMFTNCPAKPKPSWYTK